MLSFGSYSNTERCSKAVLRGFFFPAWYFCPYTEQATAHYSWEDHFLGTRGSFEAGILFCFHTPAHQPLSWWATSVKERRNSERRTGGNVERERNVSNRAQVMKLVLVIQRLTSHHQVILVLYVLQVVIVTRKLQTVMKVILSASYVVVENHQSNIQLCSGSIVTRVASGPTPTVPWDATQLHVTLFVDPVLRNEKLVPLL